MRSVTTLILMCAAAPAVAQSSAHGTPVFVGNTLTGAYSETEKVVLKAKADGSYVFATPDGKTLTGHWVADRDYLCMINTPTKPNAGFSTRCEKVGFAGRKIGESWNMVDSYGAPVVVTVTRGQ